MTDPYSGLAAQLSDRGVDVRRGRGRAARPRDRDAVVGLRRLGDALRRVPAAGPPARHPRARRRRRRGAPPHRHRRRGGDALPVGRGGRLRRAARPRRGARPARRRGQPEPLPGPRLQARLRHASRRRGARPRPSSTCSSASRSRARSAPTPSRCGSRTARTTPARTTCARAGGGCSTRSGRSTPRCRAEQDAARRVQVLRARLLRHRPRRLGLRAARLPGARASGRRCSSTSATTPRATNVEQIVGLLADAGRLGGFHFNNRKYADDDLIVGSVNPFELFLIFVELGLRAAAAAHHRPVAQHRGEGRGDGPQRASTCRRPTRRRCSSTARRSRPPRPAATCSPATSFCSTPTTPTSARCARSVRAELGAAEDPIAALRASGYAERVAAERDRRRPRHHRRT